MYGPVGPVETGPLRVAGPTAAFGLVVFNATFWFIGTSTLFLDHRPGLVVGLLMGWVVHRAARHRPDGVGMRE